MRKCEGHHPCGRQHTEASPRARPLTKLRNAAGANEAGV